VSFSINTNIASLQAQNYLRINSNFQSQTINEVTSGLRIVQSGDDAAGLAIANGYRSDEAVLTQGIQNANDGLSQLQIMDGGISNISQLLDRARTLATESASGTFAGGVSGRSVLNQEYQSVLGEINRQAQSIGLNTGGTYAKNLSVFIGGGQGTTAQDVINNGTVSVNLGNSTVDTRSLGLQGFTAGYQVASGANDTGLYDLSDSSATSVSAIIAANGNQATTAFTITGPGFSSGAGGPITVNVNLANVSDTTSLVTAINAGISAAGQAGSAQAQAFAAANVQALVHTGSDGHQQLLFESPLSTFSVAATDTTSNAFLGNLGTNTGGSATNATSTGEAVTVTGTTQVAGGTQQVSGVSSAGLSYASLIYSSSSTVNQEQTLNFSIVDSSGAPQTASVTLNGANLATPGDLTAAGAVQQINAALQATDNPALQGIVASTGGASNANIFFSSSSPNAFTVNIGAQTFQDPTGSAGTNADGFAPALQNTIITSSAVGVGATSDISTQAGAESAVSALANSVSTLGSAQAAVGKGENQFNYAINLAQSQLTNTATAESTIRDANLATEAANLTKAQILLQAGVAALSQANSAPQIILSLLKS
jgi:flagellin